MAKYEKCECWWRDGERVMRDDACPVHQYDMKAVVK